MARPARAVQRDSVRKPIPVPSVPVREHRLRQEFGEHQPEVDLDHVEPAR
jgi:hypothetical protein